MHFKMKFAVLSLLLFMSLLLESSCDTTEKIRKQRKHKKYSSRVSTTPEPENSEKDNALAAAYQLGSVNGLLDSNEQNGINDALEPEPALDPCIKVHCGAGRVCQLDADSEPECVCIPSCPIETESRRKVCSNHNETWDSDCSVYQHRCFCDTGNSVCKGEDYKHVHIEYYGECREMQACQEDEMTDFPRRMRDWLFNIMSDLADRSELSEYYLKMKHEGETNLTRSWINAAVWKFCDLDSYPVDRSVSRHELFPIRAPLMALEHCIAPFLDTCDSNDDHKISISEWAKCLELDEDDIDQRCEEMLMN